MDCMEALKTTPDKYYDLAVVDPPYGDAIGGEAADTHTHTHTAAGDMVKVRTSNSQTERGVTQNGGRWNRFGERFDRYKLGKA